MVKLQNEKYYGALLNFVAIIVSLLSGLVLTPVLVRYLGRNDFGLYQLMGSFVAYLSVLDLGFSDTVVRFVAKYNIEDERDKKAYFLSTVLLIYLIISIFIAVVGFFIYFNIEYVFSSNLTIGELSNAKMILLMLLVSVAVTVLGKFFSGLLDGEERFVLVRIVNLAKSILNMVLGVVIVMHGANSVGVTLLNTVLNMFVFVSIFIMSYPYLIGNISLYKVKVVLFKEIMSFSIYIFLQSIMSVLYWRIGGFVLGATEGTASVALFAIALQINHIFLYSTTAISSVLLPSATKLSVNNSNGKEHTEFMIKPARYSLMITAFMTLGFVFIGKEFLELWVGKGFEQVYSIVLIIVIASLIPRLQNAGTQLARAYNMHKFFTGMYFVMGLCNILLTVVLAKRFGALGAAASTAFFLVVGNTIGANFFYKKYLSIDIFRFVHATFRGIIWAILAASCIGICLNLTMSDFMLLERFLIKGFLISIVYIVCMIKWGVSENELFTLKKMFKIYRANSN